MKYLGIDYGTKRVGIATSDDEGRMAFPFRVISNTRTLVEDVAMICTRERIDTIIMGESHNFQNQPNPLMKEILPFAEALKEHTMLPVVFMSEVLSSQEAMRLQGDNAQNDSSAAAIVLQSYLDKINPPRKESQDDDES
jgi:putative Holliday junction resolvase